MTIGDVLAMIAGVTLLCVSLWALLVGGNLLFARCAETARARLESAPLRALGTAVAIGGVVLINQPNGALKLFGWVMLLGLLAIGALGGTGVARLAGERVRQWEPKLSEFAALRHGALLVVVAAVTPLIGWYVVVPLLLLSSLRAGFHALRQRDKVIVAAPVEAKVVDAEPALRVSLCKVAFMKNRLLRSANFGIPSSGQSCCKAPSGWSENRLSSIFTLLAPPA